MVLNLTVLCRWFFVGAAARFLGGRWFLGGIVEAFGMVGVGLDDLMLPDRF